VCQNVDKTKDKLSFCGMLLLQGFTLNFMFEPNEYFTNPVLTKEYFIRFSVEDDNPLGYEGPDIVRCTGSVLLIHVVMIFVQIMRLIFG